MEEQLKMQPEFKVQINEEGECINSWNSRDTLCNSNISGDSENMSYIIHTGCQGYISILKNISPFKNVLFCKKCNLRMYIPKSLKTWNTFIEYFKNKLQLDKLYCPECKRIRYAIMRYIGQKCEIPYYLSEEVCEGILKKSK